MIQRLAITIAGIAATVVLTVGLVAAGLVPASSSDPLAEPAVPALDATVANDDGAVEPAVVYVKPAPKPKTVVVEKPAARRAIAGSQPVLRTDAVRFEREEREDHEGQDHEDREEHDGREEDDD
jgi:hypothetical protein